MDFEVVEKIHIRKDRCKKIGSFLYDPEIDGLYQETPWHFPVQIGITHGLTKCQVTPMFLKLPFIMKSWCNHDILLRQIELLKLVQEDKILMHGSCFGDRCGGSTLIVGLPNAGKTYETYRQVRLYNKPLISEEYTVLEKGKYEWNARPYKPVMRTCFSKKTLEVCGMKMSFQEKVWLFMATLREKLFPFMYEAVIWKEIPASGKDGRITKIMYGSSDREVKDWKEFAILCENEFPFMSSEFLQAYAIVTGFDILKIQEKQRRLIKEFVESVYSVDHSAKL